jgi:hypothetical protein
MKATFMKGGYFKYDIDDELSILSVNSIYFSGRDKSGTNGQVAEEMLNWLDE